MNKKIVFICLGILFAVFFAQKTSAVLEGIRCPGIVATEDYYGATKFTLDLSCDDKKNVSNFKCMEKGDYRWKCAAGDDPYCSDNQYLKIYNSCITDKYNEFKNLIKSSCIGGSLKYERILTAKLYERCCAAFILDENDLPYFEQSVTCKPLLGTMNLDICYQNVCSKNTSVPVKIAKGESYTMKWSAEFPPAQTCSFSVVGSLPGGNVFKPEQPFTSSPVILTPIERGIYTNTLTCSGFLNATTNLDKGQEKKFQTVYVGDIPDKPTVTLKVEPTEIKKGESATLSWTSENAASLSINQGIGVVRPQGSIKVTPNFTTRYTITASGEFTALGTARDSATIRVISPEITEPPEITEEEIPPEEPELEKPVEPEKPVLDLKINGQDGPLTIAAPASFNLSWNLDQYCIAYGSWFGVKTKAGEETRAEKKAGTYNYKLYCPGVGSDSVTVKVVSYEKTVSVGAGVGAAAPEVPMPIAEASISLDGKNFSKSVRVTRGEPVKIWLSAAYDVTGDKKASRDDTGRWTSNLSLGGRCEWNYDLNQGTPTFEAVTFDPQNPEECAVSLGELTFYDKAGVYRYGVLRLVQNDGKVSNIGYVNIAVNEPPAPDTPPIIDLRINDLEGPMVTLGAPAEYIISWKVKNADSCAASGAWLGDKFLAGSEKFVASSKRELTYTLTCIGKLGTTVKSINLKVAELPICDFSALPILLSKSVFDRQSVLIWKCQFANSCSINPEVGAGNETFGSIRVSPKATTEYILTCQNLEGSSSFSQTVEVE